MTERVLLITCCSCAWHHRISQLAAHDVIGWLMLLQISKSSESLFHTFLEPSRPWHHVMWPMLCQEIMWCITWCVMWPVRWLTTWWSMWLHMAGSWKYYRLPWHSYFVSGCQGMCKIYPLGFSSNCFWEIITLPTVQVTHSQHVCWCLRIEIWAEPLKSRKESG